MSKKWFIILCLVSFFIVGPAIYILKTEIPWEYKYYTLEEADEYYFSNFITKVEINATRGTIKKRGFKFLDINNINEKLPNIKELIISSPSFLVKDEILNLDKLKNIEKIYIYWNQFLDSPELLNQNKETNGIFIDKQFFQNFNNLTKSKVYFKEILFKKDENCLRCRDESPVASQDLFNKNNFNNIIYKNIYL